MDICLACKHDDMFPGLNTARKAAWLKLTQLECASDRKDSRMLLRSIRRQKWRCSPLTVCKNAVTSDELRDLLFKHGASA